MTKLSEKTFTYEGRSVTETVNQTDAGFTVTWRSGATSYNNSEPKPTEDEARKTTEDSFRQLVGLGPRV